MKTKHLIVAAGMAGVIAIAGGASRSPLLASGPVLQPMVVGDVAGTLRIQQSLPGTCDNIDQSTGVTGGRIEMSPADGVDTPSGKLFTLTRATATFAPFTIHRNCMTQNVTKQYTGVAVQLIRAASAVAVPAAAPGSYSFTIPKGEVMFYETSVINGELQPSFMLPKEDVTGSIDLVQRTFSMRVAVETKLHFEWGCIPHVGCAINEDRFGTLTATLSGVIALPDADRDGVPDQTDNCRFASNPDQSPVLTPTVTPPAGITLASCLDSRIGTPIGTDLCDARPVTFTNNAPSQYAIGANLVTWTGTDGKGRSSSATQDVTVVDTTNPAFTFVPLDIARNNCGPVSLGAAIASDDCAPAPAITNNAPAYFLNGPTVVTWTARDVSGNAATAPQTVTVTDTTPPDVACTPLPTGNYYRIVARDACLGATAVRLGSIELTDGEIVKIEEIGQPGIRLLNTVGPNQMRHFHVGKGEGLITAVDPSGNAATAFCSR